MGKAIDHPFKKGDIIWFERHEEPVAVFYLDLPGDTDYEFRKVGGEGYSFEEILYFHGHLSGPYRVTQSEDWSAYEFRKKD